MRRLLLASLLVAAAPAVAQTAPPAFYAPINVAVETAGVAEVRIVRGSPSTLPSTFHITTNDFSMMATAIWPADYPNKVDITLTMQPGQLIGTALIPLTHHNSFQDTKVIALRIDPVDNATIDRTEVPLVVFDGDVSHIDAWKLAPAFVEGGFARLRVDSDGFPKIETYFGSNVQAPDYRGLYPSGVAGEVWRITGFGFSKVSNRPVIHAVKFNESSRDGWFYQDDMQPVQAAVWLGDPTVPH